MIFEVNCTVQALRMLLWSRDTDMCITLTLALNLG